MVIPERARAYAKADFRDVNAAFLARLVQRAAGHSPSGSPSTILDLGTGPGDIALMVADQFPSARVIAVDASRPMLDIARANFHSRVRFVYADATRTPFPDRAFDLVYSSSLLHHLREPRAFWGEVRRVCAPGGLVFLRDLYRPATEADARRIVAENAANESNILREDFYNSLCAAYTPEELRQQLVTAGLPHFTVDIVTDRHMDAHGRL